MKKRITTFDTAENYGLSEVSLGNWMRDRKNRDKLVIISKGCHPYDGKDRVNPEELIKDILVWQEAFSQEEFFLENQKKLRMFWMNLQ